MAEINKDDIIRRLEKKKQVAYKGFIIYPVVSKGKEGTDKAAVYDGSDLAYMATSPKDAVEWINSSISKTASLQYKVVSWRVNLDGI